MQTEYGRDLWDEDQFLQETFAEREGKPIRLRLQPSIYRKGAATNQSGQFRQWRNVMWSVDADSIEEVLAFREALRAFFEALSEEGPTALETRLRTGKAREGEAA